MNEPVHYYTIAVTVNRAEDEKFMALALSLAKRRQGLTHPNPAVGAVIVKRGLILGAGFHRKAGGPHAETLAIKKAGAKAKGATLYVNLEPCRHFGFTPPCTDAVIKSGIKRVVVGAVDPNPVNSGKGIRALKEAGISVTTGVLKDESRRLNEDFFKYIRTGRPFVILKAAMSLDGKIATSTGDSKWITGGRARRFVHELRSRVDAVMVGANTVKTDDPMLTSHGVGKNPLRIILDSLASVSMSSRIVKSAQDVPTLIMVTHRANKRKLKALKDRGLTVLFVRGKGGAMGRHMLDLKNILEKLGQMGVVNILVEGGGRLNTSFVESRLVDKAMFFVSPMIIGGEKALRVIAGRGVKSISDAVRLKDVSVRVINGDILVEGYVHGNN